MVLSSTGSNSSDATTCGMVLLFIPKGLASEGNSLRRGVPPPGSRNDHDMSKVITIISMTGLVLADEI